MFAFAESLKRREIQLIRLNANISLLSIKASALISNNISTAMQPIKSTEHQNNMLCFTTGQIV